MGEYLCPKEIRTVGIIRFINWNEALLGKNLKFVIEKHDSL